MKDAYEVLYQKEADIARVRQEIESLTIAASILAEDDSSFFSPNGQDRKPAEKVLSPRSDVEDTGTGRPSAISRRSRLWGSLKRKQS
jgi:hypothetical protein